MKNQKRSNKRVTSNKTKHVEAEKKLTDLTKKVAEILDNGYDFFLGRMFLTDNNGYQNFLVFAPMLSSRTLDNNTKGTYWILTRISPEKLKPCDTNLELAMPNLANGRVVLKFNNPISVQKRSLVTSF